MAEQGQRARDGELVKKKPHKKRGKKKLEIERTIKKIELCDYYHQSFHCDEENKEVLNEKGVQTQGSWHSIGRPPKQDEKLFDQYEFVNKTVMVRFYVDIFWYYIYCLSLSFYLCSS